MGAPVSDEPKYKEPLVYDDLDPYGSAGRALVSIANSLAILADETAEISPIAHAAFIVGDAMNYEEDLPAPTPDRSGN